ncbi:MAG: hypothetical protein IJH78_03955 [Clostridia bacterium]|nr:hypothetical protein [Clostridia bacterium]
MAEGGVKIRITGNDVEYEKTLKGLKDKTSKVLGGTERILRAALPPERLVPRLGHTAETLICVYCAIS